jgi:uncharacterized membrane protein YraQ (UPF0718 family)
MNKLSTNQWIYIALFSGFLISIAISISIESATGIACGLAFWDVLIEMMKILPFAFILIGLIEVWVSDKVIIKHLGKNSGYMAYLWVLLLAGISVGGIFVGLPLAQSLQKKGASLSVIFVYLGFVGVARIPMTIFEISFMGLPFTFARLAVAIPAFLVIGIVLGKYLSKRNYSLKQDV